MRSIALFPCPYTEQAKLVGELAYSLDLQMCTDEMLFSEVERKCDVPKDALRDVIYENTQLEQPDTLKREEYVNLLRWSLNDQLLRRTSKNLFYGFHTSLLDSHVNRVLKVLITDTEDNRIKRAMKQESFPEDVAREYINRHDKKVNSWAQFLFEKDADDPSQYDVVLHRNDMDFFNVISFVLQYYEETDNWLTDFGANRLADSQRARA